MWFASSDVAELSEDWYGYSRRQSQSQWKRMLLASSRPTETFVRLSGPRSCCIVSPNLEIDWYDHVSIGAANHAERKYTLWRRLCFGIGQTVLDASNIWSLGQRPPVSLVSQNREFWVVPRRSWLGPPPRSKTIPRIMSPVIVITLIDLQIPDLKMVFFANRQYLTRRWTRIPRRHLSKDGECWSRIDFIITNLLQACWWWLWQVDISQSTPHCSPSRAWSNNQSKPMQHSVQLV